MKTEAKKPDRLLMVPVIVWAFTFTFGTIWMLILMNVGHSTIVYDLLLYTLLPVIALNIAVVTLLFISGYYHEYYRQELHNRMYLVLSNLAVAEVYFILMCRFAKFLN